MRSRLSVVCYNFRRLRWFKHSLRRCFWWLQDVALKMCIRWCYLYVPALLPLHNLIKRVRKCVARQITCVIKHFFTNLWLQIQISRLQFTPIILLLELVIIVFFRERSSSIMWSDNGQWLFWWIVWFLGRWLIVFFNLKFLILGWKCR